MIIIIFVYWRKEHATTVVLRVAAHEQQTLKK